MGKVSLLLVILIIGSSIGGLSYLLYKKLSAGDYRYYKGEIRKTPRYYKAKPENAPNYYKGSLNKVPNYYKKDIKDLPNYYKPPSEKKESDRASRLRSLKENW